MLFQSDFQKSAKNSIATVEKFPALKCLVKNRTPRFIRRYDREDDPPFRVRNETGKRKERSVDLSKAYETVGPIISLLTYSFFSYFIISLL